MNYQKIIDYLFGLEFYGIKLGLQNMQHLMELLGNPHQKFKAIHIAGTNGKGSVSCYLGNILKESGYKAGVYTSPHLIRFEERIQINGLAISESDLIRITELIIPLIRKMNSEPEPYHPTFFEVTTAIAFYYFAEQEIDYAVIEVGLGGRLDATNIVDSKIQIITNIDFDHMQQLGNTLPEIACEKAGIIKEKSTVITGATGDSLEVIRKTTRDRHGKLIVIPEDIQYQYLGIQDDSQKGKVFQEFNYSGSILDFSRLRIHMLGEHQVINAVLAVSAIEILVQDNLDITELINQVIPPNTSELNLLPQDDLVASKLGSQNLKLLSESIPKGLETAFWPGRLELVQKSPKVLLDGAHNEAGAVSLARALKTFYSYNRLILVIGISQGKERENIFPQLIPLADEVIITRAKYHKAVPIETISELIKGYNIHSKIVNSSQDAVKYALQVAHSGDLVCITGSLYLIGEIRALFVKE